MNRTWPMVELLPTRRRAEAFSRALAGEETTDARLQELLETATRLAAVPLVEPRHEFRDSLRERLLQAAAVELPAQADQPDEQGAATADAMRPLVRDDARAARRRRRLVAVATGLVLVGGGTGVAAASEQALPGDVLYPVKRTIEDAQVSFAQGAGSEGRALLDRASTRLDEAEALGSDPSGTRLESVATTLDDFAVDASNGGDRLLDAYAVSGDPADLRALRDFTAESHETLGDLAETLPPDVRPAVMAADETVVLLDGRAMQVCPDCTAALPLLSVLTQEVSLPRLDADASPYVPGSNPLTVPDLNRRDRDDRPQQGPGAANGPPGPDRPATPALPDVDLTGPGTRQQTGQGHDAAPDQGGGDQPQQRPGLDLGDLLAPTPAPSTPPRSTDGPDLGGLDDVTKPLTEPLQPLSEPLDPLLDDTRKRLGDAGGLGDLD